ncbi:protein of unknown function [Paenibacillus alvei]|uniref:Uncharacterized protein n=1 Tax=Paenibacillus alvei TaxID=44250 RepID=A0A383RFV0_PAEAL|nr:protein of unknown function [Paenibacillus alvei]
MILYSLSPGKNLATQSEVIKYAVVAELADALDSGSSGSNIVEVRVLSTAPYFHQRILMLMRFFLYLNDLNNPVVDDYRQRGVFTFPPLRIINFPSDCMR